MADNKAINIVKARCYYLAFTIHENISQALGSFPKCVLRKQPDDICEFADAVRLHAQRQECPTAF
jgi:hypothetical protein